MLFVMLGQIWIRLDDSIAWASVDLNDIQVCLAQPAAKPLCIAGLTRQVLMQSHGKLNTGKCSKGT
jgi:hypothetical protein